MMTPQQLKEKLREKRESMPQNHAIRLHRGVSWLLCAEKNKEDFDLQFISQWIAFNSCYSTDEDQISLSERETFNHFLNRIVDLDYDKSISKLLWNNYSGFIRLIIENQFLFSPFWDAQKDDSINWKEKFDRSKKRAFAALANQKVSELLSIVLDRLYVLRNQLIHGGATYNSQVNREQVKNSCRLLAEILPVIFEIMLENEEGWGEVPFPVIEGR